jgi:hypothetical protein
MSGAKHKIIYDAHYIKAKLFVLKQIKVMLIRFCWQINRQYKV